MYTTIFFLKGLLTLVILLIVLVLVSVLNVKRKPTDSKTSRAQVRPIDNYVRRFAYFNPNPTDETDEKTGRPKVWKKGDCVIRAFCGVLDCPWDDVFADICRAGAACHNLPNADETIDLYARKNGLIRRTLRRQTSVSEFAGTHDGTYLLILKEHAVCVKDHKVWDTSDCGHSKVKIYYEKCVCPTEAKNLAPRRRKPSTVGEKISAETEAEMAPPFSPTFVYFDPNPEGVTDLNTGTRAGWYKFDNTIRAISGVTGQTWDAVFADLCRIGAELHDMPDARKVIVRYLKEKRLRKKTLPSRTLLSEFATSHDGVYLVQLRGGMNSEFTCVKENKIHDIYDYSDSTVRTYYTL